LPLWPRSSSVPSQIFAPFPSPFSVAHESPGSPAGARRFQPRHNAKRYSSLTSIDKKGHRAQHQVALAEAEFQVLKQELVLQHLIGTGEPTDQAGALLEQLRSVVRQLTERGPSPEKKSALRRSGLEVTVDADLADAFRQRQFGRTAAEANACSCSASRL